MEKDKTKELAQWLFSTAKQLHYGEVIVQLKIHNGEIRRVVRTTSESDQSVIGIEQPNQRRRNA